MCCCLTAGLDWLRLRQETEALQEDELAKLPASTFEKTIVMPHPDNPASNLKYLWDFFPPSYNCPLREKVRHSVVLHARG